MAYIKEHFGEKNIEKLRCEHIQSFLLSKVSDGLSLSSVRQYCSALEKLETVLNMYSERFGRGRVYDFSPGIKQARVAAKEAGLSLFDGSRAY